MKNTLPNEKAHQRWWAFVFVGIGGWLNLSLSQSHFLSASAACAAASRAIGTRNGEQET